MHVCVLAAAGAGWVQGAVTRTLAIFVRDADDARAVLMVAHVLRDRVQHVEVALKLGVVPNGRHSTVIGSNQAGLNGNQWQSEVTLELGAVLRVRQHQRHLDVSPALGVERLGE